MKKIIAIIFIGCFFLISCKGESNPSNNKHPLAASNTFSQQTVSLFGVTIKGSKRDDLRKAIMNAGGVPRKLEFDLWTDVYDPKKILDGATTLKVAYTRQDNKFAEAEFFFPSTMIFSVLNLIRSQYGEPSKAEINQESGLVFATWVDDNNISIRVERDKPNDVTSLRFYNLKNCEQKLDEMTNHEDSENTQAQETPISLFGVSLKNANRELLRKVLIEAGLKLKKSKGNGWVDIYDAHTVLKGATTLEVVYTKADGRFVMGEYTFPSFMNPNQIQDVINLIISKYGQPNDLEGNLMVGPVQAVWRLGQMGIVVSREWPDTTTYLTYVDMEAKEMLQKEREEDRINKVQKEASLQKNAI